MTYCSLFVRRLVTILTLILCLRAGGAESSVERYQIDGLPLSIVAGETVEITVRGLDVSGRLIALTNPPPEVLAWEADWSPPVILTEWSGAQLEIMNVSSQPQSLSGWSLKLYLPGDLVKQPPLPSAVFSFPDGTTCDAGKVKVGSSQNSGLPRDFLLPIAVRNLSSVALIVLSDSKGEIQDVFAPLVNRVRNWVFPDWLTRRHWIDSPVAHSMTRASRIGGMDHNDLRDWVVDAGSIGRPNPGLRLPFLPARMERSISILEANLVDGVWRIRLRFMEPGSAIALSFGSLAGTEADSIPVRVTPAPPLRVSLPNRLREGTSGTGSITLPPNYAGSRRVQLTVSKDADHLSLPSEIEIPTGETNAVFTIATLQNNLLEGTIPITVLAETESGSVGSATFRCIDDESTVMSLFMNQTLTEKLIGNTFIGSISIDRAADRPIAFSLHTSIPDILSLPDTVVIPRDSTRGEFLYTVVTDFHTTGPKTVTVAAREASFAESVISITVEDTQRDDIRWNESFYPLVSGPGATTANLPLSVIGPVNQDLEIRLRSTPPGFLAHPSSWILAKGERKTYVPVQALETSPTNLPIIVTLEAEATNNQLTRMQVLVTSSVLTGINLAVQFPFDPHGGSIRIAATAVNAEYVLIPYDGTASLRLVDESGMPVTGFERPLQFRAGTNVTEFPMPDFSMAKVHLEARAEGRTLGSSWTFDWVQEQKIATEVLRYIKDALNDRILALTLPRSDPVPQLLSINAETGEEQWRLPMEPIDASRPVVMALSSDSRQLYLGCTQMGGVIRVDLLNRVVTSIFPTAAEGSVARYARALAVAPGDSELLMVMRTDADGVPLDTGLVRAGTVLPLTFPYLTHDLSFSGPRNLDCFFATDAGHAFAMDDRGYHRMAVSEAGLTLIGNASDTSELGQQDISDKPAYDGQLLYVPRGGVLDAESLGAIVRSGPVYEDPAATFPSLIAPESETARLYRLSATNLGLYLSILSQPHFNTLTTIGLRGVIPTFHQPEQLEVWNGQRVSFVVDGELHLVKTPLPTTPPNAGISLGLTSSPKVGAIQTPFTYQLRITNHGPEVANGPVIVDRLPTGVTALNLNTTAGTAAVSNGIIRWEVASLAAGDWAEMNAEVSGELTGSYVNLASLYAPVLKGSNRFAAVTNILEVPTPPPARVRYPYTSPSIYDPIQDRYYFQAKPGAIPSFLDWRTGSFVQIKDGPTNAIIGFSFAPGASTMYLRTADRVLFRYDLQTEKFLTPITTKGTVKAISAWGGHPDTVALLESATDMRLTIYVNGIARGLRALSAAEGEESLYWSADGTRLFHTIHFGPQDIQIESHQVGPAGVLPLELSGTVQGLRSDDPLHYLADRFFTSSGLTFPATNITLISHLDLVRQPLDAAADPLNGEMYYAVAGFGGPILLTIDPLTLRVIRAPRIPQVGIGQGSLRPTGSKRLLLTGSTPYQTWALTPHPRSEDSGSDVRLSSAVGLFVAPPPASVVESGSAMSISVTITNLGTSPARLKEVRFKLPNGLRRLDGSATEPLQLPSWAHTLFAGEWTFTGLQVAADRPGVYDIPFTTLGESLTGTPVESSVSISVTVVPRWTADLRVVPITPLSTVSAGETLSSSFLITNVGPANALQVKLIASTHTALSDTPKQWTFRDPLGVEVTNTGNGYYSVLSELPAGTGVVLTMRQEGGPTGVYRTATVSATVDPDRDPDPTNNTATCYGQVLASHVESPVNRLLMEVGDMVASPSSNILYLASTVASGPLANQVLRVNLDSGEWAPWIPTSHPSLLALDQNAESLIVGSLQEGTVVRYSLETQTQQSKRELTLEGVGRLQPMALSTSPTRTKEFAVLGRGGDQQLHLVVYDEQTERHLGGGPLASIPTTAAVRYAANGQALYVRIDSQVHRYKLTSPEIVEDLSFLATVGPTFEVLSEPERVIGWNGSVSTLPSGTSSVQLPAQGLPVYDVGRSLLLFAASNPATSGAIISGFDSASGQLLWEWQTPGGYGDTGKATMAHDGRLIWLMPQIDPSDELIGRLAELVVFDPTAVRDHPRSRLSVGLSPASQGLAPIEIGRTLTNQWFITNSGPWTATEIIFSNSIPAGMTHIATKISEGTVELLDGKEIVRIPRLAPNKVCSISVVLRGDRALKEVLIAGVRATQPDPDPSDNQVSSTTSVLSPAVLSGESLSILEPSSQSFLAAFSFSLSRPTQFPVSFVLSTEDGVAKENADYKPFSRTLTIPPGSLGVSEIVEILSDQITEGDEVFYLAISSLTNAIAMTSRIPCTIRDTPPALTIRGGGTSEASGSIDFQFTLPYPSTLPVTVCYVTIPGTATPGKDFTPRTGTVTIPAGKTSALVQLTPIDDLLEEGDETLYLTATTVLGALPPTSDGLGIILDDDGSYQVVLVLERLAPGVHRIRANTIPGAGYELQSTTGFEPASWVSTDRLIRRAIDTNLTWLSFVPTQGGTSSFYRVVRLP